MVRVGNNNSVFGANAIADVASFTVIVKNWRIL
jgi:hypothetical protein